MTNDTNERSNINISAVLDEARANYVSSNPESLVKYEEAKEVMPGGNTRTILHYAPLCPALYEKNRRAKSLFYSEAAF